MSGGLRGITSDGSNFVDFGEFGIGEDGLDDRSTLLAGCSEDNEEFRHCESGRDLVRILVMRVIRFDILGLGCC